MTTDIPKLREAMVKAAGEITLDEFGFVMVGIELGLTAPEFCAAIQELYDKETTS